MKQSGLRFEGKGLIKLVSIVIVLTILFSVCLLQVACSEKHELYYDKDSYFGLYFYGDGHDINNIDMLRSSSSMDVKYFDPKKPTVIWVHGWESTFADCDWELTLSADAKSKAGLEQYSFVKQLKEKGYNVAAFQYQSEEVKKDIAEDLGKILYSTLVDADQSGYSMAYLMASELCLNLGESYSEEIMYVGHSCGSFVSLSINYYINYFIENKIIQNKNLLAKRITLADPYFNSASFFGEKANGMQIYLTNEVIETSKDIFFGEKIKELVDKQDVAIDVYLGMGMASSTFKSLDQSVFDKCFVVDMAGLRKGYGDTSIHVLTRDWIFMNLVKGDIAGRANTTNSIKSLRGAYLAQSNKKLTIENEQLTPVE